MEWVAEDADARQKTIEGAIKEVFGRFLEKREVEVVVFSSMTAHDLASAMLAKPVVLKTLLACCNVAGRAIERDLGIKNLDTYSPGLSQRDADAIAGYVKPYLPAFLELQTLSRIDRMWYIDKEVRKGKGRWERSVRESLNRHGRMVFHKRKFEYAGEEFELDAAAPETGAVRYGVDIKRIEARRDIHKRCDEIVNKAVKLKAAFPRSRFGAVIYYPFIEEHGNVQNRLQSPDIDGVVFASEAAASIGNAVRLLLAKLRARAR